MSKEKFNMSEEEFETLFRKYNIVELDTYRGMFDFVYDYELDDVLKAFNKVYKEKEGTYDHEVATAPSNKFFDIKNKNKLLTDKELDFLYELADTVALCLDGVYHMDVSNETYSAFAIQESVNLEKQKRESARLQKVKVKKESK